MPATCQRIDNGYRLANERFEATIAVAGATNGITQLIASGQAKRQPIKVTEAPVTLRLATSAQRIDIVAWNGHAGSGNPVRRSRLGLSTQAP